MAGLGMQPERVKCCPATAWIEQIDVQQYQRGLLVTNAVKGSLPGMPHYLGIARVDEQFLDEFDVCPIVIGNKNE